MDTFAPGSLNRRSYKQCLRNSFRCGLQRRSWKQRLPNGSVPLTLLNQRKDKIVVFVKVQFRTGTV